MHRKRSSFVLGVVSLSLSVTVACTESGTPTDLSQEPIVRIHNALETGGFTFGVYRHEFYQGGWEEDHCSGGLCYADKMTANFANRLDDFNTKSFSLWLDGTKSFLEDTNDQWESDAVHVLWLMTHGRVNGGRSEWSMWETDTHALSSDMRWGDESTGQRLFVNHSCHVMQTDDPWTRLGGLFRGGLRIMVGSHDWIYWGWTTDDYPGVFASNLHNSWTITDAWRNATGDWGTAQDPATMATGITEANCWARLDNATFDWLDDNGVLGPLRDGSIANWCMYYWNDV